jgi:hypothetical protein
MSEPLQTYRLSPQQRRAWLLGGGDGERAAAAVLLDGRLDLERLSGALQAVVARHEILRTTFRRRPGSRVPHQVVGPAFAPTLTLRRRMTGAAAPLLAEVIEQTRGGAAAGAPLSAAVHGLGPDRHLLVLSLPALCADEAGLEILVRELAAAYAEPPGAAAGADADERLQYGVVSDWLNELLESEDSEPGRLFWRGQLTDPRGTAPALQRVAAGPLRAGAVALSIDATTAAAIDACATRLDVLPAGLLAAAWQALLWRVRGPGALPVAAVIDGRSRPELTGVIGPLSRHLPLGTPIAAEAPFAQLAITVDAALEKASSWQETYDGDALLGGRTAHCLPFAIEYRAGRRPHRAGALSLRVATTEAYADRFAVLLSFVRTLDGYDARLRYDASRVPAAEASRLAEGFEALLGSVLTDAAAPVAALPPLSVAA